VARNWQDPDDAPDLPAPQWAEKLAEVAARRGRATKAAAKIATTIRLDADPMEAFRDGGVGWQSRINTALREWLKSQERRDPQQRSSASALARRRQGSPGK
jgi:uncharacterized protein (DUF4415 family)